MLSDIELKERIEDLCKDFLSYLDWTLQPDRLDTPVRHFHIRTIKRLKSHSDIASVLRDEVFFDYLYATLVSWGMDSRGAKLCGFGKFMKSIRNSGTSIEKLARFSLRTLSQQHALNNGTFVEAVELMENLLLNVRVSETDRWLVANTKTLHHILPELIPPIDGKYTLRFFFDNTRVRRGAKSNPQFFTVFNEYLGIYDCVSTQINSMVDVNTFNSSSTKVIDNAIIGYVRSNLKSS